MWVQRLSGMAVGAFDKGSRCHDRSGACRCTCRTNNRVVYCLPNTARKPVRLVGYTHASSVKSPLPMAGSEAFGTLTALAPLRYMDGPEAVGASGCAG